MFSRRIISAALWMTLIGILSTTEAMAQSQPAPQPIKEGSVVNLEYTLTEPDGKLIESNKGKDPLVYTQGRGQIIPGLEKALLGMHQGETRHVAIPPEEAYGVQNPQALREVPRDRVPPDVEVGSMLVGENQTGRPIQAVVKEIKETVVVLDFNHPLAGKVLIFDVKVLSVAPPKSE